MGRLRLWTSCAAAQTHLQRFPSKTAMKIGLISKYIQIILVLLFSGIARTNNTGRWASKPRLSAPTKGHANKKSLASVIIVSFTWL